MRSTDSQAPDEGGLPTARGSRRRPLRVFLSYRRSDASGHAGRLYDLLVARYGHQRVFMDIDAIPLGSDFGDAITRAVTSCDVLIGRGWSDARGADGERRLDDPDDFVRREIESALAQGVAVVPACVQGAEMPRADELPPSLAPLTRRQGVQLSDAAGGTTWGAWFAASRSEANHDLINSLKRALRRVHTAPSRPAGHLPPS